jgi:hypothetical protein
MLGPHTCSNREAAAAAAIEKGGSNREGHTRSSREKKRRKTCTLALALAAIEKVELLPA